MVGQDSDTIIQTMSFVSNDDKAQVSPILFVYRIHSRVCRLSAVVSSVVVIVACVVVVVVGA